MFHVKHFSFEAFSPEVRKKLKLYQALLEKWQRRLNLVSSKTLENNWRRHFEDSFQLLSYLPSTPVSLIDFGSGAGFPGLVLAICSQENLKVTLVESNFKKCTFLENVSRETFSQVEVICSRIEDLPPLKKNIITARGLSSLSKLCAYAYPLMEKGSVCLFLKGKGAVQEIKEAEKDWKFSLEIYPSLTDSEGRILKLEKLEKLSSL